MVSAPRLFSTEPLHCSMYCGGRVGFEGCKTNRRCAEHCRREIEVTGNDARRRNEVIALLCFRKNKRNVVTLVAPRVHVYRGEENAEGCVQHDPVLVQGCGRCPREEQI